MMGNRKTIAFFLMLALLLTVACSVVRQEYPEKRVYALDATRKTVSTGASGGSLLRVRTFSVSPGFDDTNFVYREEESRYYSDYYNEFLVDPGPMISEEIREWLDGSGLFGQVVNSPGQVLPAFILEGHVASLMGDFRDTGSPKAMMEIQFFMVDATGSESKIILHKTYQRAKKIKDTSPDSLVLGWNEALSGILSEFESDLRKKRPIW